MKTRQNFASIADGWESRSHIKTIVLIVATVCGGYLCYRIAVPFLSVLVWAIVLAVLFNPLQRWLELKLKHPNLAAVVCIIMIGLVVVLPATFVGQRLVQQVVNGAQLITANVKSGDWRHALENRPRIAYLAGRIEQQYDLPETVVKLNNWLTNTAGSVVKGSVVQVIGLCLTFYLLFFFLRDRRKALQSFRYLSPLTEAEMDRLLSRVNDTINATVYGTLAVSAAQGLLGGLMFWWLGLPAPLLWGVVMAILSLIPVLGAFIIWIPAALLLAIEGSWAKALILTVWGGVVVGSIDNLLRPILVGRRLKLHTILAFISMLGDLMLFGPAGLILGPVTLTVTVVLLEAWRSRADAEAMTHRRSDKVHPDSKMRGSPEVL